MVRIKRGTNECGPDGRLIANEWMHHPGTIENGEAEAYKYHAMEIDANLRAGLSPYWHVEQ